MPSTTCSLISLVYVLEALSTGTVLRTKHCRGASAPSVCQPSELPPFGICSLDKWTNFTSKECNTAAHGTSKKPTKQHNSWPAKCASSELFSNIFYFPQCLSENISVGDTLLCSDSLFSFLQKICQKQWKFCCFVMSVKEFLRALRRADHLSAHAEIRRSVQDS